jgi:cytochrome b6-f complex iron-sulfur subunit
MNRREFLVKTGLVAGSVVLTVSSLSSTGSAARFEDVTITVNADSSLAKVGGYQIVDSSPGKIIVIHATEDKFVAYSAKCTHRGAIVEYDANAKQIHCPKHGSRFDTATGSVVKSPADDPLTAYPANASGQTVTVKVS